MRMATKKTTQKGAREPNPNAALIKLGKAAQAMLKGLQSVNALLLLANDVKLDVLAKELHNIASAAAAHAPSRPVGRPKLEQEQRSATNKKVGRPKERSPLESLAACRRNVDAWDKAVGRKPMNQVEFARLLATWELAEERGIELSDITKRDQRSKKFQRRVRLFQDDISKSRKIPGNPKKI